MDSLSNLFCRLKVSLSFEELQYGYANLFSICCIGCLQCFVNFLSFCWRQIFYVPRVLHIFLFKLIVVVVWILGHRLTESGTQITGTRHAFSYQRLHYYFRFILVIFECLVASHEGSVQGRHQYESDIEILTLLS